MPDFRNYVNPRRILDWKIEDVKPKEKRKMMAVLF